jgi:hypothetical protein
MLNALKHGSKRTLSRGLSSQYVKSKTIRQYAIIRDRLDYVDDLIDDSSIEVVDMSLVQLCQARYVTAER